METRYYDTKIGRIGIVFEDAVTMILLNAAEPATKVRATATPPVADAAFQVVATYFNGSRAPIPRDLFLLKGTAFQQKVWEALYQIPYGETRTYKEIATQIGQPNAARAVGMACNKNPLPLVIPCHRVIGSNGTLTGFAGGLNMKELLLSMEQSASPQLPTPTPLQMPLDELKALGEENYRAFIAKLVPGNHQFLGIRSPLMKKVAKQHAKTDWQRTLRTHDAEYFEERLLLALVLGYADLPFAARLEHLKAFVPLINNWAVCDSLCGNLKFKDAELPALWEFLQPYVQSPLEYDARFAAVMILCFFLRPAYIDQALETLHQIAGTGYYAQMAVAWALAECFIKFPDQTWPYLKNSKALDDFTFNKALQKMTESFRVNAETKDLLRSMKRKSKKRDTEKSGTD